MWPLFIWGCKLNLVIRMDELLGMELIRGAGRNGQEAGLRLLLLPGRPFDW